MSWKDQLRPASFRGVPFFWRDLGKAGGRRTAVHQHVQREKPFVEDLGRQAREFTITAYLIGSDYLEQRDRLEEALELPGAGKLVHPTRGEIDVTLVGGYSTSETVEQGGYCTVTMPFTEAGVAVEPSVKIDAPSAVAAAAEDVQEAAKESFVKRYLTSGLPGYVLDAAREQAANVIGLIQNPGFDLQGAIDDATDFYNEAQSTLDELIDTALSPLQMVEGLQGLVVDIKGAFGASAFETLISLYQSFFGASSSGSSTDDTVELSPTLQQQQENTAAIYEVVRQTLLAEAAQIAVTKQYESVQQARSIRTTLVDAIDQEAEITPSDQSFLALGNLQTQVIQNLPVEGESLPDVIEYAPPVTTPSLLVAYRLYGDASLADEIATRNNVMHPGFIIGGTELEVLSNA